MSDPILTRALNKLRRIAARGAHPKRSYRRGRSMLSYKGSDPKGAVFVQFHGGGWVGGRPEDVAQWSEFLARMGRRVYAVEYGTFGNSGATLDMALEDSVAAGDAVAKWHPNTPIIFVGHSAGAVLAFWASIAHQNQLAGLMLFSAVTDTGPGGFRNRQIPADGRADASPHHNLDKLSLSGSGPFLLAFHGRADETVPIAQVERFVTAWQDSAPGTAELFRYGGQKHGFQNQPNPRLNVQIDVEAALARRGFYKRPAFLGGETQDDA